MLWMGATVYLQGDLQTVFDALYQMGIINPVLEMDWSEALKKRGDEYEKFLSVLRVANSNQVDVETLIGQLVRFDQSTLSYLAMEVAREYADFHGRETLQ